MIIYIPHSLPRQPAFIYAAYPAGTTVADSPDSPGYTPADVLASDELNGWKPASTVGAHSLILTFPSAVDLRCLAVSGNALDGVSVEVRGSTDGFVASDVQILPATALAGENAAWQQFTLATYSSCKLIFSGHSSDFIIKHLVVGGLSLLPFFEDGMCLAPLQADGDHLISHAGRYLGSVTNWIKRPFSLDFGQVDDFEEQIFAGWAQYCIAAPQAFFLVPDTSESPCHFGWVDPKYKYEPVQKVGLYTIPKIPFTARAV